MMGRKRKAMHNKRHPCTVSLPVDIHLHLDKIKDNGLTISRYIESLIRKEMTGNQKSLTRHVWYCPDCDHTFHINQKLDLYKHTCGRYLEAKNDYQGTLEEYLQEEE